MWGVATSAFQMEGAPDADWTHWDSTFRQKPEAIDHYNRCHDDLRLICDLGANAYRFSLEWSRIEPDEGRWNDDAIAHYQGIIDHLRADGIEPMLTIHHFTHPRWFAERYPWHSDEAAERFLKFAIRAVRELRGVKYWITFNEPYVMILGGYFEGCMPPGLTDPNLGFIALGNLLSCHGPLYDAIHSAHPGAMVSVAHNMSPFSPWHRWNPMDRLLSAAAKRFYNHSLIDAFLTGHLNIQLPFFRPFSADVGIKGKLDFFGVNYYTRVHMRFNPLHIKRFGVEFRHRDLDGHGVTEMGWEIHPRGLRKVLRYASRLGLPMIITENGVATRDIDKKVRYMQSHLEAMQRSIQEGLDVRGYFYWTLLDNYEWLQGYDQRFGLYKVDMKTLKRTPTVAAAYYAHMIEKINPTLTRNS